MNRISLAIALLVTAGTACAQGYVGAGLGQSRARIDCSGTLSCDKTDTSFKIFGGYLFSPYWGVEGAYYNQGQARLTAADAEAGLVSARFKGDGVGVYALGVMPLERWSAFAKIGAVSANVKLDASSSVFGGAGRSERHTNFGWGLGGSYAFDRAWAARLEYEEVRVKFLGERNTVGLWSLGAVYRF